uniref:Uncharacterized protein n=1 Tax=Vannella robusta TaxID=1487602 RepID=A0A7S4HXJ9_9EUKA
MVRVGRSETRNTQKYKGIGLFHTNGVLTLEAIDGSLTIVNITEHHKTRVAFGITKGGSSKHFTNYSGSASHKCLSGLVVPMEDDDMLAVLKATVEDVAALMNMPTTISEATLLQAIQTAVSSGAASLTTSGSSLTLSPACNLLNARKWVTQIPAAQYNNCSLTL